MSNDAISDIASHVQQSPGSEGREPGLGDGAVKAGMAVGLLSTGKFVPLDASHATAGLHFVGILARHHSIALDTAITDSELCECLKPKSGRKYAVFIEDPGANVLKGTPVTFGTTTAGSFKIMTTKASTGLVNQTIALTGDAQDIVIEKVVAYLAQNLANGDTVTIIEWA